MKVFSSKQGLSADSISDPEEKEVSDDDDDDRNHKHRRRDMRSQSVEEDASDQVLLRPYRKHNKPFTSSNSFQDNESPASGWKNFGTTSLEKEFSGKFDRRRLGNVSGPRTSLDHSQSIRTNHAFPGDPNVGRGRGRDFGTWRQHDSRFNSADTPSQILRLGPIPPSFLAGRGLPNASSAQSASWNAFGLRPGISDGSLDTLQPVGLQGMLRQSINSSLNMSLPHQRCRDFEERGFCLRGDMCPMEHGLNRIVIEDVQSLSQFNLPVSLPSGPLMGTPAGPGLESLPALAAPSSTLINEKELHGKRSKPGVPDDTVGVSGAFSGSVSSDGADLYDPDQPLWNNTPETPRTLLGLQSAKIDESESFLNNDAPDHLFSDNVRQRKSAVPAGAQSASLSNRGRFSSSRNRLVVEDKTDPTINSHNYHENGMKEESKVLSGVQGGSHHGKHIAVEDAGKKPMDLSFRTQGDGHKMRKPSQKALRTLFVNGIPQESNKKGALFSHFKKFGEVIDIYIPASGERAFVQFSKREEAEAALKAPDAVMGNRFIKLMWANRDTIPDDVPSRSCSVPVTSLGINAASISHNPLISNGRENPPPAATKGGVTYWHGASVPSSDHRKSANETNPPPLPKKLETLEQLKEEIRRKQEMLDKKRNDFRRQLDQLQKQGSGTKAEVVLEQAAKRPKIGTTADIAKTGTSKSSDPDSAASSGNVNVNAEENNTAEIAVSCSPKIDTSMQEESSSLRQHVQSSTPAASPFLVNRYKLDKRPTGFKITPPLPADFANVAVIREHFALYGDISSVELEEAGGSGNEPEATNNCTVRVSFSNPHSAQRAYVSGKCWKGHSLSLKWIPNISGNDPSGKENSSSTAHLPSDGDIQIPEKTVCDEVFEEREPEDSPRKLDIKPLEAAEEPQTSSIEVNSSEST